MIFVHLARLINSKIQIILTAYVNLESIYKQTLLITDTISKNLPFTLTKIGDMEMFILTHIFYTTVFVATIFFIILSVSCNQV